MQANSFGDLIVVYSGSPTGPGDQDPFWSTSVFRRDLFGLGSPVIFEINPPVISEISSTETVPVTTAYQFTVPTEMAHLTATMNVPARFMRLVLLLSTHCERPTSL
jgi:hypothetical protein